MSIFPSENNVSQRFNCELLIALAGFHTFYSADKFMPSSKAMMASTRISAFSAIPFTVRYLRPFFHEES
ncbi:hypothetical protein CRH15_18675 [Lelliottia amnigena]|nr:hypothetical protein CO697_03460 [Lelliottia amnigena]PEG63320.1 hypothetical protein CRH15_18675 [Lelliottia amnigena]